MKIISRLVNAVKTIWQLVKLIEFVRDGRSSGYWKVRRNASKEVAANGKTALANLMVRETVFQKKPKYTLFLQQVIKIHRMETLSFNLNIMSL